jgi:quinol-cytochrome oxidoreductase complex cytochrome b subunit
MPTNSFTYPPSFFALHFLIQFVITVIVLIRLLFLHQTESNNALGLNKNSDKIPFHPHFTVKDTLGFAVTITILTILTLKETYILTFWHWSFTFKF